MASPDRETIWRECYERERREEERKAQEERDRRIQAEHEAFVTWRRNHSWKLPRD